jgi:hypothetical protein
MVTRGGGQGDLAETTPEKRFLMAVRRCDERKGPGDRRYAETL